MAGTLTKQNYEKLLRYVEGSRLKSSYSSKKVTVIGVTKLQPLIVVSEAINAEIWDLGENYVQELLHKQEYAKQNLKLADKIHWHLIGPLQSNKVKQVCGKVSLIHTLDRESLLEALSVYCLKENIKQNVLIQVNVAEENSKSGLSPSQLFEFCKKASDHKTVLVKGLMTMPPAAETAESSRPWFRKLRELMQEINQKQIFSEKLEHLSMGTSQDYEVAVEEGATYIRVGTTLFGERKIHD